MVKILHTSDIHLRADRNERLEALQEIIKIGGEQQIDILVISGDLFDRGVDVEQLKPELRKIFSKVDFTTVIIPGNHDKVLREGLYLGENIHILGGARRIFDYHDVRIIGLPFKRASEEEVFKMLRSMREDLDDNKHNILLFHGELVDISFHSEDFGNEYEKRYMPARLSFFGELNIDYVLAGHYHTKFEIFKLKNDGFFVYPGSPVSITRKEVGRRKVNLFEVGGPPEEYPLDTYHFERVEIELNPLRIHDPRNYIKNALSKLHPKAEPILTVKGFIDSEASGVSEQELKEYIEKTFGPCENYDVRDVGYILEDDLFRQIVEELKKVCDEAEMEEALAMVLEAFMEVKLRR